MQLIRYISPQGDEVVVRPDRPPYIFERVRGTGGADTNLVIHTPAGMDGSLYQTLLYNDREITLDLHVEGRDRADLYAKKLNLIRLCSSGGNRFKPGVLWYENNFGRWWIPAVVKQAAEVQGARVKNFLPMQIIFYCPDPMWRSEVPHIDRLAYLSGGFKFPLSIKAQSGIKFGSRGYRTVMLNRGDNPAPVELTITGTALRPMIKLVETGEYIAINRVLEAGDSLHINTTPGAKEVMITTALGKKVNAMGYIDPTSTFFLLPTGNSVLEYTSGNDNTTATVTAKVWSRYGGV